MFKSVGKNLTLSIFKTTSVHRHFHRSPCLSTEASGDSFRVSYLMDSCGFPSEKAISASKYLKFKTPNRADSVLAFFKNQGFTETQISHLVQKSPTTLNCSPEKNFLPKFKFLSSIGLSDSDIVKLLTSNPEVLGKNLKNHIQPTFNLLKDLLQSNNRALTALKKCPWVFIWDFQATVAPNIQSLLNVGVPKSNMLYTLTYQPGVFIVATEKFKKGVEEVVEMGFDPIKPNFMLAVGAVRSMSKSTWEKKMEIYKKWGWSKAEILLAFRICPWIMKISEEKINKVMDFHVNNMGFETSFVAKNPMLLSYSMEKRVIPRCLVYRYCLDNGMMKGKNYSGFRGWLNYSEKMFIKRLERFEKKTPGVLKFYQEKLNHAN